MVASKSARMRSLLREGGLVKAVGAHNGLGAVLAEQAGFDAVWASSFEISAARALPDASLLTMTDYLQTAQELARACELPIIADCDTGFGNALNVAHAVREYEAAGIAGICIEDKTFPKVNSFAKHSQPLTSVEDFAHKVGTGKSVQQTADFLLIARTEAFIAGYGVDEVLRRAHAFVAAGADAILVHSKESTPRQLLEFLERWDASAPVVAVPTTYYTWPEEDAQKAGVAMFIYANHGLRASVRSIRETLTAIRQQGTAAGVEDRICSVDEIFSLQRLDEWMALER